MTFCALALPLPIYVGFCWLRYLAERFGIPLAADKTEGPTSSIKFLGIVIDSQAMECHLPEDKLLSLKEEVRLVFGKHKIQLRELQSLLGKLNFACRIMLMGRVFFFLETFNGRSLWMEGPVSNYDLKLFSDVASSTGYGAFLGGRWSAECLPAEQWEAGFLKNLVLLELFLVVAAIVIWGN